MPALMEPYLASENVTFSGTAAQSSVFNAKTALIRIAAINACHVRVGTNPTADMGDPFIAAGGSMVLGIPTGHSYRVSIVDAA